MNKKVFLMNKKIVLTMVTFCLLLIKSVISVEVNNCFSFTSNGYYSLTSNLTSSSDKCLIFSDITFGVLDCNNYYLISDFKSKGILLNNTSFFTIKNCNFINNTRAIHITNSKEISLLNIKDYNSTYSVFINNSNNIEINSSYLRSNSISIYLYNSTNIIIKNAYLKDFDIGIVLYNTNETAIYNSTLKGKATSKAMMMNFTTLNIIYNNTFYNGKNAFEINNSNNIDIFNNNITSYIYGFIFGSSNTINVYNNIIISSNHIYATTSTITYNIPLSCYTRSITFSPCKGGNYWGNSGKTAFSDTCNDKDGNGICDSPYSLSGGTDNYPLSKFVYFKIDSIPSYKINESSLIRLKGSATLMPYSEKYNGDVSVYINEQFRENITVSNGRVNYLLSHKKNDIISNMSFIFYHSSGTSNNSFYLKHDVFSFGLDMEELINIYSNPHLGLNIFYFNNLLLPIFPSVKKRFLSIDDFVLTVNPYTSDIVVGITTLNQDEIKTRVEDIFYNKNYCSFSFTDEIKKLCDIIYEIYSPSNIIATIKTIGEGTYYIKLKKVTEGIQISIS